MKKIELILELTIFGTILGIIEDIIAIKATTDADITIKNFFVVVLIAVPFAIVGELVISRINWTEIFKAKRK